MSAEWRLLVRVDQDGWLGLYDDVLWIGTEGGPQRPIADTGQVGLLPLLEGSYRSLVDLIDAKNDELGWPLGRLKKMVQLAELPLFAISARNPYWASLALRWLREIGPTARNRIAVEGLAMEPWATQEIKHEALRLKHQWSEEVAGR
jgi:hypothetical protein